MTQRVRDGVVKCDWCGTDLGDEPRWPYCTECIEAAEVRIGADGAAYLARPDADSEE